MDSSVLSVLSLVLVVIFVVAYHGCSKEGWRSWGWDRPHFGGWRGRYEPVGWGRGWKGPGWGPGPVLADWEHPGWRYGAWPYGLYDTPIYEQRCVESTENSECGPFYPIKVGTDMNGDGVRETWKCCKKY